MKVKVWLPMLLLFLTGTGFCVAAVSDTMQQENVWNGTWISEAYTITIFQDGALIAGSYEPDDPMIRDPGMLKGTLSDDGTTFSGIWTETGPFHVTLAEDNMPYSGTGGVKPDVPDEEAFSYAILRNRSGDIVDPDNLWTGQWDNERGTQTLTQNGTIVTGTYTPYSIDEDEPGLIEGEVSDDGRELTATWYEAGPFTFTLSDDGLYFNGTYGTDLSDSAETNFWNATKVV